MTAALPILVPEVKVAVLTCTALTTSVFKLTDWKANVSVLDRPIAIAWLP